MKIIKRAFFIVFILGLVLSVTGSLTDPFSDGSNFALAQTTHTTGDKCYNSITAAEGRKVSYCPENCKFVNGKPSLFAFSQSCP